MYSEFFENLGGGGLPGRRGASSSAAASSGPARPPAIVSFKAGRINMTSSEGANPPKYKCTADTRRGEVRLVYQSASGGDSATTTGLYWQWYDRRDDSLVDAKQITAGGTWERVTLPSSKVYARDRVYVWTQPGDNTPSYDMYWMQDASEEKDEEIMVQVNQYLADPASAAPAGATDTAAATSNEEGGTTESTAGGSANPPSQSQVDALSNILQNLGMPQSEGSSTPGTGAAGTPGENNATGGGGMLTLADLQGAMAGIQSQRPAIAPLTEVVTPAAITALLENEGARNRLIALLPEEQQTAEALEENLRSPQVQQTLRALTQALLPDDNGSMDSFYSILANFSLDPADGQQALTTSPSNPIQAFLDCLLASVEKEKKEKEGAGGDDEMDGEGKQDDGETS